MGLSVPSSSASSESMSGAAPYQQQQHSSSSASNASALVVSWGLLLLLLLISSFIVGIDSVGRNNEGQEAKLQDDLSNELTSDLMTSMYSHVRICVVELWIFSGPDFSRLCATRFLPLRIE